MFRDCGYETQWHHSMVAYVKWHPNITWWILNTVGSKMYVLDNQYPNSKVEVFSLRLYYLFGIFLIQSNSNFIQTL